MNILITGATGYIGRRLTNKLIEDKNLKIRLFVRNKKKIEGFKNVVIEIYEGDTFDMPALDNALKNIDVAYYLIHSMGKGGDFSELDRKSAGNFRDACIKNNVKRIIYLGGLGVKETASEHLLSRLETGEILSEKPDEIQTLWFRAGVILGSGSASFEILFDLVRKLPVMITPKWVKTKTQPIAVADVVSYLAAAKEVDVKGNQIIYIGSEQMSFGDMLRRTAKALGLKRYIFPVPFFSPKLSSYWLVFITRVPYQIASALIEGLKSETIIQNDNAKRLFPEIKPVSLENAVENAIYELQHNKILSRWCDSSIADACDIKVQQDISSAVYVDRKVREIGDLNERDVFSAVMAIGGENGWFNYNFLWKIRGAMDRLFGGYGTKRGRRDCKTLRVGDSIDFWKVVDIVPDKRLLLFSEMKLPAKAWLELVIDNKRLILTAYYYPFGLFGILYWYSVLPMHNIVFNDLLDSIIKETKKRVCNV